MLVRGNKGFTLIELLIVIAIIVILAAVLIPNLLGARARAQITATMAELRNIATGMETYSLDNGRYPPVDNLTYFRTNYLGNKIPTWAWNNTEILLDAYYDVSDDGGGYNITGGLPTGLLPAARLIAGNSTIEKIILTHDKGIEFIP